MFLGADRAAQKLSAAVRTDITEPRLCAILAERAFKRTCPGVLAVWSQISVATFTVGF